MRRNIGLTLGRQLLAAFAQLLLIVLIARKVGPEGNGIYAMAVLLPALLANFLNLGVGPATVYYVSRREFSVERVQAANLRLASIISAAGVLVTVPIVWFWGDKLFSGVPKHMLYISLVSFPLILVTGYLNTVLQGLENFKAYNLTILLPPYVNLLGVAVTLYVLDLGVVGALSSYVVGQAFGAIVAKIQLRRYSFNDSDENRRWEVLSAISQKSLSFGWRTHLSNIITFLNYRADIVLVNFFMTPVSTGVYVIAVQISEKLWMLSQAASSVLFPRLSSMHKDPEGRLALANKASLVVACVTAFAGCVSVIVLYFLIRPIFGESYEGSWELFVWLLPGVVAGSGARVHANCVAAAGKPLWNSYIAMVTLAVNVVGNVILIPSYGTVGAAWATSFAYCIDAILKYSSVRKTRSFSGVC